MSKVFFTDLRTTPKRNLLTKIQNLLDRLKVDTHIRKDNIVAVKLHFGEKGNTAYLRPVFIRAVVERLGKGGAKPFLTDTNTLYTGSRSDSVSHLTTAVENGFDYSCVKCPIVIADGLRGNSGVKVPINGEIMNEVSIAKEIVEADCLVAVTHFKAHEFSGFGGVLKNLGMGCATKEGKLAQHSSVKPIISANACKGCRTCLQYCPASAISVSAGKASIDANTCIGCGECLIVCPCHAIEVQWNEVQDLFQKKMVEHARGALIGKEKKALFLNFLVQVSPACDCWPNNDAPIVRDIGILASLDPVSIDAASCDLVNAEESLPNTVFKKTLRKGEDKWRAMFPEVDWNIQLDHAEKLGMGERKYTIIKV
jgi:uncharacterized protein